MGMRGSKYMLHGYHYRNEKKMRMRLLRASSNSSFGIKLAILSHRNMIMNFLF
jgi:hypothetical protein